MSKKKVTYLINKIDYGGAEVGMVRLLSGLDYEEFSVTAVTLKGADPDLAAELPDDVNLTTLNLHKHRSPNKLLRLYRVIADTEVLVCSLFPSVFIGPVLGTVSRVPQIYVWRHNTDGMGRLRTYLNKFVIKISNGVLTDSDATRELVEQWGVKPSNISVLPLSGIDVNSFPKVQHTACEGSLRVGTVGRLVDQKGYPELITCAERLPEYEFHIVGDGPLANQLDLSAENIVMHGRVSQRELNRLWSTFDIYFQPSRYEGLCITAIEAMACELPVVASNVDGLTESVVHGETGILVNSQDIDGYCRALERLEQNVDLRKSMGQKGLERVREYYSMEALAKEFTRVIKC